MKEKYKNWIDNYILKHNGNVRNCCNTATKDMIESFPELKREKGWIHLDDLGWKIEHWWCVDLESNEIVDPTEAQFDNIVKYEAYDKLIHGPLPTGKCMDCGEFVYDNETFCNIECEKLTIISIQGYYHYKTIINEFKYHVREYLHERKKYSIDNKKYYNTILACNEATIKDIIE